MFLYVLFGIIFLAIFPIIFLLFVKKISDVFNKLFKEALTSNDVSFEKKLKTSNFSCSDLLNFKIAKFKTLLISSLKLLSISFSYAVIKILR